MSRSLQITACIALILGMGTGFLGILHASEPSAPSPPRPEGTAGAGAGSDRSPILLAQKSVVKKKKGAPKKKEAPATAESNTTTSKTESAVTPADDSGLKFSRDIAPILAKNCTGCHNPERRRGKFDLTTFEKLMTGSDVEKVIVPGKPDESHLVLRIRGEETPKMPQGNNNNLSDEAIAKIEKWVQAGARLDSGIDPKAPLKSYAPTTDQLRVAELKKMSAEDRDKMVEEAGRKRWAQASPKTTPEMTRSTHYILFSTLPKERASAVTKGMETAYNQLNLMLSQPSEPALDWAEKTSLFVFNDNGSFVEFVRSQEKREIETGETGTANFGTKQPYVAVVDPLKGREDTSSSRKSTRSRKSGDEESAGNERSIVGLLAEQMAVGVLKGEARQPNWLGLGVGGYLASGFDPRSTYALRLRKDAADQFQRGWTSRANEALGGQLRADEARAIGTAIVDWIMHDPQLRPQFPVFVHALFEQGGGKLDDVLMAVYNARRQDFLESSGEWVATQYGQTR